MNFRSVFKNSFYGPDFYRSLKDQPLSFSIKYFYSLAIFLSVLMCAVSAYMFLPGINFMFSNAEKNLINGFPPSLVINIEKGRASSNSVGPVYFPASGFASSEVPFANLLAVDTGNSYSPRLFTQYNTLALLTADSLAVSRGGGAAQVQSLKNAPDVKIDSSTAAAWVHEAEPYLEIAVPITVFGFFFLFLLGYSLRLLEMIVAAFLIWGILRLGGVNLSYSKAYQVGIHAMTPSILLWTVFFLFDIYIPLYFVIITLIIAGANMLRHKDGSPAGPQRINAGSSI